MIQRYWRHASRFCLDLLREGEKKNENKIQKNKIRNLARMLIDGEKP